MWPRQGYTFVLQRRKRKLFSVKIRRNGYVIYLSRLWERVGGSESQQTKSNIWFLKLCIQIKSLTYTDCFAERLHKIPCDFVIGKHLGNQFLSE